MEVRLVVLEVWGSAALKEDGFWGCAASLHCLVLARQPQIVGCLTMPGRHQWPQIVTGGRGDYT